MTKPMKDVFELPLEVRDDLVFFAKSDTCFVKVESVASRKEELYVSRAVHDAINNHDTLTEQNKRLIDMLSRVNDNYQQNLTKRNGGEPVDFGTDGEVNRVWVEVPLLKEIESFLAKHKEQI